MASNSLNIFPFNESKTCHQAFPPGEHFQVPHMPNVNDVNKLGDFDLEADRLAFIDGEGMSSDLML